MKFKKISSGISDRTWIAVIIIALVLESVWLLSEMGIVDLPFTRSKKSSAGAVEAGMILKTQENLKRRSANSLIWETANQNETLYYKDSLLTLSRSSAVLYLKDQTELQMSENTLVTLEEPDEKSNAEIRLRFSKGDVKARNPFNRSSIESKDWVVNLEKGAEVALRKGENAFEFEVLAGKATLNTEAGTEQLVESKILKLGDDKKIETIDKSLELQWKKPQAERIYTFDERASVAVEWTGQAEKISIGKSGQTDSSEEKKLDAKLSETNLELPLGSYQIRLQDQKGISTAKEVEVFPAPKIILKKPLPRDRIQIGVPQEFVWVSDVNLKAFQLKLNDGQNFEVTENFKSIQFDREQDVVWRIEGVDQDGFKVPSFYESKVYLRKDTLAAPKLKQPKLLEDSSQQQKENDTKPPKTSPSSMLFFKEIIKAVSVKASIFFEMIIQRSEAQVLRKKQVIFEWEPVEGANQYFIEISSDPEFKNPEIIETVRSTSFTWKKYDAKKKYWWRVASGNTNGKMGLFSEPIELVVIVEKSKPAVKTIQVTDANSADTTKASTDVSTLASKDASIADDMNRSTKTDSEASAVYSNTAKLKVAYTPAYKQADVRGDNSAQIQLNGGVPVAIDIQYQSENKSGRRYFFDAYVSAQKWKPESGSVTTQNSLSLNENLIQIRTATEDSRWQYGLIGRQSFFAERNSNNILNRDLWLGGVAISRFFSENWRTDLGYLKSGNFSELHGAVRFSKNFSEEYDSFFWGSNLIINLQNGPYGNGQQSQLQFLLGIDFF